MSPRAGSFIDALRSRAQARRRKLVFPEGEEPRGLRAIAEAGPGALFDTVLLGRPDEVRRGLSEAGAEPERVSVIDPSDPDRTARFGSLLFALRSHRGLSERDAQAMGSDPLIQGALMVREAEADASIAGSVHTTGDVVRAALWCVGAAPGIRTVSSSFYMVLDPQTVGDQSVLTFTDAGVVPHPSAEQLADIAAAAATARRRVVGDEPRVAFLSYSTKGSAEGPSIETVREALERFRTLMPDVEADGELQADAALVPEVRWRKAPGSPVAGSANVLVFPDLDAANISYKLVQCLCGAQAVGPILQGLARPCSDLSRGASPGDIVAVACIASLMAE